MIRTYLLPGNLLATRQDFSESPMNYSYLCIHCGKVYAVSTVEKTCALQAWQSKHGVCEKCSVPHKGYWVIPGGLANYHPDPAKDSPELLQYQLNCELKHHQTWSKA